MYGFRLRETGEFTIVAQTKQHVKAALVREIGGTGTRESLVLKLWKFAGDIVPVIVVEAPSEKPMESSS